MKLTCDTTMSAQVNVLPINQGPPSLASTLCQYAGNFADPDPLFRSPGAFVFFYLRSRESSLSGDVMRGVDFITETIKSRTCKCINPKHILRSRPREVKLTPQVHEDITGLGDDQIPVPEEWRCKIRRTSVLAFEHLLDRCKGRVPAKRRGVRIRVTPASSRSRRMCSPRPGAKGV